MSNTNGFRHLKIFLALLFLCSLSFGCSSGFMSEGDSESSSNPVSHIEPTTVASTVHHIEPVLHPDTSTLEQKLSGVAAQITHGTDTITLTSSTNAAFTSASDISIKAGDILAGNVSSQTPHGFLKKVTGVRHENGKIHVDVVQIPLEEAIKDANFSFGHPLKKSDLLSFSPAMEGVRLNDISGPTDEISLKLNIILYDKDGNPKTTNDQIKATGTYTLDLSLNGDLQIDNFQLTKMKLYSRVKSDLKLTVGSSISILPKLDFKQPLGSFDIAPLTFFVGPVPVVIITKINFQFTCKGSLALNVSVGTDQSLSFAMGLQVNNGAVSPYTEGPVSTIKVSEAVGLKASIEAGIGPELEASIYGLAGPTIGANVYFSAEIGASETNLALASAAELKLGLKGTVGGQIDALTKFIGKLEINLFNLIFWKQTIPIYGSKSGAPLLYPAGVYDGIR